MRSPHPSYDVAPLVDIGYRHPMIGDLPHRLRSPLWGAALAGMAATLLLAVGLLIAPQPFAIDRAILAAVHGAGPAWLRRTAVDLTALGGGTVLTLVVLATASLLLVGRRPGTAAMLVGASWSGGRVVQVVKDAVSRPRPDLADRLVAVSSASFPSAHAANSATVYLTLAALAAQFTCHGTMRRALLMLAILLVAAIGASRVYLGVHWPSDVLAGWSFGALWATGWWWLTAAARPSLGGAR